MDLHLQEKVAVVTGASKGISHAVTRSLAAEGAHVVAGARSTDSLELLERVVPASVDLASPDGPVALVERAVEEFGHLDYLVNNVGALLGPHASVLSIPDADWEQALTMNLLCAVRASRAAVPHIVERGGAVVNVSSINAFLPIPSNANYAAAKAALTSFSKSLALELGTQGVRVNAVSPGPTRTPMWTGEGELADRLAQAMGTDADEAMRTIAEDAALGRFTEPEEVAALVLFVLSDQAAAITGADYVIDSGVVKTT